MKRVTFNAWELDLRLPSNIDTEIDRGNWYDVDVKDWICEHVKPGMNCIDAGANWGLFTLLMAQQATGDDVEGVVHSWEPAVLFYDRLVKHLAMNDIKNVVAFQQGLGDVVTTAVCNIDGPPYQSTARVDFDRHNPEADNETMVATNTIDDYWCDGYGDLGFIKIDVDGCEERVLLGGEKTITRYEPIMAVECMINEQGMRAANWLADHGYALHKHRGGQVAADYVRQQHGKAVGTVNLLALPK